MTDLRTFPVHLGLGALARSEPAFTGPEFTGMEWYAAYAQRTEADGAEGRLVSLYDFTTGWDSWEMHPDGDEVVVCVSGEITLIQEHPDGRLHSETLEAGQYLINPAGVWHTADVPQAATVLFVTAGRGTQGRPR